MSTRPAAIATAIMLLPWLLAAESAALTAQNYLTPQAGTIVFSVLVILTGLAIAAIISVVPERLGKAVSVVALLVCFDAITQGLQQLNGHLDNGGVGPLLRHVTDAVVFAAAAAGLYAVPYGPLRQFASVAGILLLASVILFPHADSSLGWAEKIKPGPLGRVVVHLMLDEHTGIAGFEDGVPGGAATADALRNSISAMAFFSFRMPIPNIITPTSPVPPSWASMIPTPRKFLRGNWWRAGTSLLPGSGNCMGRDTTFMCFRSAKAGTCVCGDCVRWRHPVPLSATGNWFRTSHSCFLRRSRAPWPRTSQSWSNAHLCSA